MAEWTRALGRPELLKMEEAFKGRCVPFRAMRGGSTGTTRLGLPVADMRSVFRDLGQFSHI